MNEKDLKARYRNKLKKIIIEVWNGEKWIYVKTLLDPLKEFRQECLAKVSLKEPINNQKENERFAYSLLNEPKTQDTIKNEIEDAKKKLNSLMESLLKKEDDFTKTL